MMVADVLPHDNGTASPARQLFRQAVAELAARATAAFPSANGRIPAAVQLVLAGDVTLLPDGTAHVGSQRDSETVYRVNGTCPCPDAQYRAEQGRCKHRYAVAIHRKASALVTERLDQEHATPQTEPPAAPTIPPQYVVELHGKAFVTYAGLLQLAHARGLVSLTATFLTVTAQGATASATAVFADGRTFTDCADASPDNVNKMVKAHFPRMASTRAKARVLRDALCIGMVAVEELE